ncbi:MAG: aldehyde dehydrogenase family protein, partial [Solirubrobacterales bacterium]|nr:aldehyde dehydrogenase family protein [Solirubrobacterales bacterium]
MQGAVESGAASEPRIRVENPATGGLLDSVPNLGAAEVAELAARARAAQPAWAALSVGERGRVFLRLQKWFFDNAQRALDTVVSETGKTYEDAQLSDLGLTAIAAGYWAKHAGRLLKDQRVSSWPSPLTLGKKLVVRREPLGVVGVIGPWNFPLVNSFADAIPALMAGNAVILKPSEITPLSSLLMAEALRECGLPRDLFLVATGEGATGAAVVDNVDAVMFTGSTATGRRIAAAAGERLIPCFLELGGNDPMLVLADADVERAANAAVFYSMVNSGQVCMSIERAYVEAPVYDEFVDRVVANVRRLRQGPPGGGEGTVDVGAMSFPPQVDIVDSH